MKKVLQSLKTKEDLSIIYTFLTAKVTASEIIVLQPIFFRHLILFLKLFKSIDDNRNTIHQLLFIHY